MTQSLAYFCIFLLAFANAASLRSQETLEAATELVGMLAEPGNEVLSQVLEAQSVEADSASTSNQQPATPPQPTTTETPPQSAQAQPAAPAATVAKTAESKPTQASFPDQVGDFDDDEETDTETLHLATKPDKRLSSYKDISDLDEIEAMQAKAESDNPVSSYVFDKPRKSTQAILKEMEPLSDKHILDRDEDDIPDDIDDDGDDNKDGDTFWVIVTSFEEDKEHTGKVWAIPEDDNDEGFTLIQGLNKPVSTCFDVNHEFLYVCDQLSDTDGVVYQYEIDWDTDDTFELKKHNYAIVYKGNPALSCVTDEYGNLFFSTKNDKIHIASYLDLWSGFTNQYTTIYDNSSGLLSGVQGIDVVNSDDIWFVNNKDPDIAGILNKADAKTSYLNSGSIKKEVASKMGAWGVSVSDDFAFFTTDTQVFCYDFDDDNDLSLKSLGFTAARGVSYGDDQLYVVDHATGEVYQIDADDDDQEFASPWIRIKGAYGVHAVNWAIIAAVGMLMVLS